MQLVRAILHLATILSALSPARLYRKYVIRAKIKRNAICSSKIRITGTNVKALIAIIDTAKYYAKIFFVRWKKNIQYQNCNAMVANLNSYRTDFLDIIVSPLLQAWWLES